ncbi:OB-fold domain-containing protein, partial [Acidimicrobiaceae bacterium AH-315-P05]|nr:OB-fold domain-containing protein [Acidimicrobiaceae bacterium AH-315-P05]
MSESAATNNTIPLVDYLVLGDSPHLVANQCDRCGARYFDRRNGCAGCFGTDFSKADVVTQGEVASFTIVAFASPGVDVPFVAAVVDCDGTSVRANLVNVEPDDDHVKLGMQVKLTTYSMG